MPASEVYSGVHSLDFLIARAYSLSLFEMNTDFSTEEPLVKVCRS